MKFFKIDFQLKKFDLTYIGLVLLLYLFMVAFMPLSGFKSDRWYWTMWCELILNNGLKELYEGKIDYPPLYPLILYLFASIQGTHEEVVKNVHLLKAITLIFDFSGAFLAVYFVPKSERKRLLPFFLLFNPAYLYNTYLWNQVDAIFTTMCLASLVLAVRQKVSWSLLFFLLAMNVKLQSIVFLPLLALIWLSGIRRVFSWQRTGLGILLLVTVQYLILAPFDAAAIYHKVIVSAVGRYPNISLNAFNFWHLVLKEDPMLMYDNTIGYAGVSYKQWGLLLFLGVSFIILLPMLRCTRRYFRGKINSLPPELVFLTAGMISLSFFFFLTEMHERYCHPAIVLLAAYSFLRQQYKMLVIVSVAYFLNLEQVMQYYSLENYETLIFNKKIIAGLFAIVWLLGIYELYRRRQEPEIDGKQ